MKALVCPGNDIPEAAALHPEKRILYGKIAE
jgi:hypothetical protein